MILDITQFKDSPKILYPNKTTDNVDEWLFMVTFLYNLYILDTNGCLENMFFSFEPSNSVIKRLKESKTMSAKQSCCNQTNMCR